MPDDHSRLEAQLNRLLFDRSERGLRGSSYDSAAAVLEVAGLLLRAPPEKRRLMIVTGFPVVSGGTAKHETDGPVGSLQFATFLADLAWTVVTVTDRDATGWLTGAADVLGLKDAVTLDRTGEGLATLAARRRAEYVLFVERPGRFEDGRYYNMRGADISDHVAPLDDISDEASRPTLISIGDGGNEVGFGGFRPHLGEAGTRLSASTVDHLLIAGVSNWGILALQAAMHALAQGEEKRAIGSALARQCYFDHLGLARDLGLVSGMTKRKGLRVDGIDEAVHRQKEETILDMVRPT